jgi:hypothetical protein
MMCIWHNWDWVISELHDWQDLAAGFLAFLAGILGFVAAIWTVRTTLRSERRKEQRELLAISKALTAEVFGFGTLALQAHSQLKSIASSVMRAEGLTIHEIEDAARFVTPTIYSNIGSHVGLLGDQTHEVVLFFARIQSFTNGVARMRQNLIEDATIIQKAEAALSPSPVLTALKAQRSTSIPVGSDNSKDLIENLLIIAETAGDLLPHLTKGTIDEVGAANFQNAIKKARSIWGPRQPDPTS